MYRRRYLGALGVAGVTGLAGCSGGSGSDGTAVSTRRTDPNVVLPEPDREFASTDVPYLAWGQRVPDVRLGTPLSGGDLAVREAGRPCLYTFFYSLCVTVCPVLVATLANVQTHALNNGYAGAVLFTPVTFDPGRDTAERLRSYGRSRNASVGSAGWRFLRPAGRERARDVVADEFGVGFDRRDPSDTEQSATERDLSYMFNHVPVTLLVNADGYVERAYRTQSPDTERIIADLAEVRAA